jgi:hypothetical protein
VKQVAENNWRVEENAECFTSFVRRSDGKKNAESNVFWGFIPGELLKSLYSVGNKCEGSCGK